MRTLVTLVVLAVVLDGPGAAAAGPPVLTTIGLSTLQVFASDQADKRGPLVVVEVWEDTSAATAGVEKGDIVLAIDGTPVAGKDVAEEFKDQLHGAAGGKVRLTLLRPSEGMRTFDIELARVPYPHRQNPAFESFAYSAPRSWRLESYRFPLPWSPKLAYTGIEDILFAPQFAEISSIEYHSLVWVWWLDGRPPIDADSIRSTLLEYFRGLSEERGKNYNFTPNLDMVKVTAMNAKIAGAPPSPERSAARGYLGDVVTYSAEGKLITLHVDVEERECSPNDHTALLFTISPAPPEAQIWEAMRSIRSTFRCRRT
jgi:hypothetical protein